MKVWVIKMQLRKETKGTFVYEEVDKNSVVRSLYIKKSAFVGEAAPTTLNLEVKA